MQEGAGPQDTPEDRRQKQNESPMHNTLHKDGLPGGKQCRHDRKNGQFVRPEITHVMAGMERGRVSVHTPVEPPPSLAIQVREACR